MLDFDDFTPRVSPLVGFLLVVSLFVSGYFGLRGDPTLDAIPAVGFNNPILSYLSAVRFFFDGFRMLREADQKNGPGLIKVPGLWRWMVLATESQLIDDIRKASDDVLCHEEPIFELLQQEYTIRLLNAKDSYHTDVIRSQLTRNIALTFKDVREELILAMDDLVPTHDSEDKWVKVPILNSLQSVICRVTNRVFVGVPLCRDHDYQSLNLNFATNVVKFGTIIGLFPKFLKPIVSRTLSNLPSQIRQEMEFIRPIVEERFATMEEYGEDWDGRPNDMLMWLMSEAKSVEKSLDGLARRLLLLNLASVHSTSLTLTQVLYRLLAHPEYIEPLRQEVDTVTREKGWTKAGIDNMYKIDSFLRETQRIDDLALFPVKRLTLRPFTFSNGVTIPAGTIIAVPGSGPHKEEAIYNDPFEFDGFRFAKLRESLGAEDTSTSRFQSASASGKQLAFGLGRHACPGRFFAVNEIKGLFAYIVATYDIKFEEGKGFPSGYYVAGIRIPRTVNVMFRMRKK